MSLDTIQPQSFQPQIIQRNTLRPVQGGSLLDKPSIWSKIWLGLRKFGSIFTRIGASVMSFFPGLGTVASSALYGISNLAESSYQRSVQKRFDEMARSEAAATTNIPMITPGFGMFGGPGGAMGPDVNDGLGMQKLETVLSRETAAQQAISGIQVPAA